MPLELALHPLQLCLHGPLLLAGRHWLASENRYRCPQLLLSRGVLINRTDEFLISRASCTGSSMRHQAAKASAAGAAFGSLFGADGVMASSFSSRHIGHFTMPAVWWQWSQAVCQGLTVKLKT